MWKWWLVTIMVDPRYGGSCWKKVEKKETINGGIRMTRWSRKQSTNDGIWMNNQGWWRPGWWSRKQSTNAVWNAVVVGHNL